MGEEDEDAVDSNDSLKSSALLHEIYEEEVFNKADNLIEDHPSLPNTTQRTAIGKIMTIRKINNDILTFPSSSHSLLVTSLLLSCQGQGKAPPWSSTFRGNRKR